MINIVEILKPKSDITKDSRKIVAIGGGEILNPDLTRDTVALDKEIIRLSGKKFPKLLFIPTASRDAKSYCKNILEYFGTELGCKVEFLLLYSQTDEKLIRQKIDSADIVYVGGGNTYAMIRRWRALGVDRMLSDAMERGTVMSGLSAGAICWFRYGASDSRKFKNPDADMIKVSGLDFINSVFCPHFNSEPHREEFLRELMKKTKLPAIGVDDCCAVEIIGSKYRIISSDDEANAYKIYWKNKEYHKETITKSNKMRDISELLSI